MKDAQERMAELCDTRLDSCGIWLTKADEKEFEVLLKLLLTK